MSARVFLLTYALSLLLAGTAWAAELQPKDPQPKNPQPNPDELWRDFPLDPAVTTPVPPLSTTLPEEPSQPAGSGSGSASSEPRAGNSWTIWVVGGLSGSLVLVACGGVALARRRHRLPQPAVPAPESRPRAPSQSLSERPAPSPQALLDEARALAREAAECDMFIHRQPSQGVNVVSAIPNKVPSADEAVPSSTVDANTADAGAASEDVSTDEAMRDTDEAASGSASSTYAEIGERVAGVLSAAEAAADRIRADARREAEKLPACGSSPSSPRRTRS